MIIFLDSFFLKICRNFWSSTGSSLLLVMILLEESVCALKSFLCIIWDISLRVMSLMESFIPKRWEPTYNVDVSLTAPDSN